MPKDSIIYHFKVGVPIITHFTLMNIGNKTIHQANPSSSIKLKTHQPKFNHKKKKKLFLPKQASKIR